MRKEVIFAVLAGAILGLVVAFGVYRANSALKPATTSQTPENTPEPKVNVELSIVKPVALSVVTSPTLSVSGITLANATLAISGETKSYILEADASGAFSQSVALEGGLNEIKVFSFDKDGGSREKSVLVIYSSEFSKYLSKPATASESAEVATDSVRQKVNQKIEMIEKSPTAYVGTITDKTGTTIQIKNLEGEIKQISIDEEATDFVKIIDTTKTIESTDLAIGDFIIAMGLRNGNKILDAKRILVTTAYKPSARKALMGNIQKDKATISLKPSSGALAELKFGTNWDGPELSELNAGDKVIAIGDLTDSVLSISLVKKI